MQKIVRSKFFFAVSSQATQNCLILFSMHVHEVLELAEIGLKLDAADMDQISN